MRSREHLVFLLFSVVRSYKSIDGVVIRSFLPNDEIRLSKMIQPMSAIFTFAIEYDWFNDQ